MRAKRRAIPALAAAALLASCSPQQRGEWTARDVALLHRNAVVVDTHADTTPLFQDPDWRFDERHAPGEGHVDLPRLEEGGVDVQFWSIYLPRREGDGRSIREALERIDAVYRMVERHADRVVLADTLDEVRRGVAAGKLVSMMGLEGGHIIEGRLEALRSFRRLGVRYMTLTHSFNTAWADSSGITESVEPEHGGLTAFGEEVVHEMNRLGMLVDVSHVSDATFHDALAASRAPLIASHSSCRAITDHPRNLDDAMLRALAAGGGVVMLNFYSAYIHEPTRARIGEFFGRWRADLEALHAGAGPELAARQRRASAFFAAHPPPRAPLDALLDHFDHAIRVAGADHVGLGSDWDGVASMPVGLEDVSALPMLTLGLLERGHPPATVRKVLGENLLRVLGEAERVARELVR